MAHERRVQDDAPISAQQVALLQRGAEILAARPVMPHGWQQVESSHTGGGSRGVMRSTCVAMDDHTAQQQGGSRWAAEIGCGRYARQAAVALSVVSLVCCVTLLQLERDGGSALSAAPVTLSTSVLANSGLDWLGGGTYGDPFPASDGVSSPKAHLAPAARRVEASWKKTVGNFFRQSLKADDTSNAHRSDDSSAGDDNAPYAPPRDREPQGMLLSPAAEGQRLWQEQIKAMQAGELQANREVMNTVELIKRDEQEAKAVHPKWVAPKVVKLSASSDRKAAAHARLTAVATKTPAAAAKTSGAAKAVVMAVVKAQKAVTDSKKTGALKTAKTQKLSQPSSSQVLKSIKVKPTDLSALDVATSDSSRNAMSSFFDSLAARDEAKHVLHEARYPRTHSVRALLPTSIMPSKPPTKEINHLEKEVTWLRRRVEVLQDALLLQAPKTPNKVNGAQQASQQTKKAAPTKKEVKTEPKHAAVKQAAVKAKKVTVKKVTRDFLALTNPPPRGCPLFAAPGENLPVDCPR